MENREFQVGDVVWFKERNCYKVRAIILDSHGCGLYVKTERGESEFMPSELQLIENGVDQLAAILAILLSGRGCDESEKWAIEEKCDKLLDELAQ